MERPVIDLTIRFHWIWSCHQGPLVLGPSNKRKIAVPLERPKASTNRRGSAGYMYDIGANWSQARPLQLVRPESNAILKE